MIPTPKFKIGQSVYFKDEVDNYISRYNGKYDTYSNQKPSSSTIVGIMIEECSGGFQIHYKFALFSILVPEICLISELPELESNPALN